MPTTAEIVAEYFAAIRAMDADRWVNIFAPDAVTHDPVGTPPVVGHEALRQFITSINTNFKMVSLTENGVFVCGNSAAAKWIGQASTHTGKSVTFEGIDVIDTNDEGKITLVRAFWDPTPLFAALQD